MSAEREAYRSLAGHMLRREIYAQSGSIPYTVTESSYTVEIIQRPQDLHHHSVMTVLSRETITLNYERNNDPRIIHTLILEQDQYGNVLKKVEIAYGRKANDAPKIQRQLLLTYSEFRFTWSLDEQDDYLLPKLCESRMYQLYRFEPEGERYTLNQFTCNEFALLSRLETIPFEQ
jgi:hypothetical protein